MVPSKKHERVALETARATVPAGVIVEMGHGAKHPCLLIVLATGLKLKLPFGGTPRSGDTCVRNTTRQQVRRLLTAHGVPLP
jgi:hypothetical protein